MILNKKIMKRKKNSKKIIKKKKNMKKIIKRKKNISRRKKNKKEAKEIYKILLKRFFILIPTCLSWTWIRESVTENISQFLAF